MDASWERIAALARAGTPFALCTIVRSTGSVPRRSGARMVVLEDGSILGSMGGAGLELQVRERALAALAQAHAPALHDFDLWYRKADALSSLCGGSVTVYIEAQPRAPHVLVIGGGHVGLALAQLLDVLEYAYSVADVRPEYASPERFPRARAVFTGTAEELLGALAIADFTHIVLLGHSWEVDLDALASILPRHGGWIGLVGSRAKAKEMRERLAARGVNADDISRLRSPVGVDIACETAAEVACAIAAEIVDTVRAPRRPARS